MTIEELVKTLQKYPINSNVSVWQDDHEKSNDNISVTYCPETNEIILY